jgi:hypothetical protein
LVAGCGDEEGADAAPRDPTLRGFVKELQEVGLEVGPELRLSAQQSQAAAVGRAAGLANELAGAKLRADMATETKRRKLAGALATLRRYANEDLAAQAHDRSVQQENRLPDAGRLVPLLAGEYTIILEGPKGRPPPGISPGAIEVRPAGPPDPAAVQAVEQALAQLGY